ncbi:MAG TPA: hypothetical protein VN673_11860 [Clostridia bacterium]|nr:hypothetical protein [Clostridia bacterium]
MKLTNLCLLTAAMLAGCFPATAQDHASLAGSWRFELDRADTGVREQWFARELTGKFSLPGSLAAEGIGDPVTPDTKWMGGIVTRLWFTEPEYGPYRQPANIKLPFWLTPETYYAGAAWFQRTIHIPRNWADKRIVLFLERPHWETRVWVDQQLIGTNNTLATPHEFDLGSLTPGKHTLTIRVDNRMVVDIGENSHSISDHTQGNWNGIVGKIQLQTTPLVYIQDLQVFPQAETKTVRVSGRLGNATRQHQTVPLTLSLSDGLGSTTISVPCPPDGGAFKTELYVSPKIRSWDEFRPNLYELTARLGEPDAAKRTVRFGFRDLSTKGTQFTLNGHKIFFRGTLDCCIYPLTGYPPTDVAAWKRIIRICKAHGLNMIRFHSWCPPEAAFIAADELGFYYQVGASSWANQTTTLGDGKPVDAWIYAETDSILKHYGNHPSFLLMPYGNEPGGPKHSEYLAQWVNHYKGLDSRRLWTSGSGWPQIPENQFHVTPDPRIQAWGDGLRSRINANAPETTTDYRNYINHRSVPVISHEIGQWCVYPNFKEIRKYTGHLKARNFEIFRDSLTAHHMGDLAQRFLMASGKLQTLCYKEDIESALRTPGMGGFQLLDLHDFPGQGTALVGVLDPFWESKGYVTAREYSRFCNATVPLARLPKRAFTSDESLSAELELAHFGHEPLADQSTTWAIVAESGKTLAKGHFADCSFPIGNTIPIGKVEYALNSLPVPARYKLVVKTDKFENDWDFWVYPPRVTTSIPEAITVTDVLDDRALQTLRQGGKVLWTIPPHRVAPDAKLGKIALGFSSIFWNTAWTHRQPPHTLGILCDPDHPLFAAFPTEYHSNWQWWHLVSRAGAMILDDLPPELRPTVQVIDDWVTNRRLGLVFEASVGAGKLIVCSIDINHDLEGDPVRRQFRHSLLQYMSGGKFNPRTSVDAAQLRQLAAGPSALEKMGAVRIKADSEESGN